MRCNFRWLLLLLVNLKAQEKLFHAFAKLDHTDILTHTPEEEDDFVVIQRFSRWKRLTQVDMLTITLTCCRLNRLLGHPRLILSGKFTTALRVLATYVQRRKLKHPPYLLLLPLLLLGCNLIRGQPFLAHFRGRLFPTTGAGFAFQQTLAYWLANIKRTLLPTILHRVSLLT